MDPGHIGSPRGRGGDDPGIDTVGEMAGQVSADLIGDAADGSPSSNPGSPLQKGAVDTGVWGC